MTPEAFSGWTEGCVTSLPSTAFNQTNELQIANLSLSGAAGKQKEDKTNERE